MSGWYILVGRTAVPATMDEWAKWSIEVGREGHRVADTTIGPLYISTVFLGLDHSFGDEHPILFETMVLDPDCEPGSLTDVNYQTRSETWGEAELMHERAIAWATVLVAGSRLAVDQIGASPVSDIPGDLSDKTGDLSDSP